MALTTGTKLGPYEIVSPLGVGGMGEVYRAHDTRLGRDVAVKVMPPHLSSTPEFRERFEREARAISSLQHPNICALFDVGSQDGLDYLVMECMEGENLAERIRKGPLPAKELMAVGVEIAAALEKAHKQGIIHRDLKPSNIMLTKSGAKLMDFGLAKPSAMGAAAASAPLLSAVMTASGPSPMSPLTQAGSIVGTIQYMSPEQIEGKEADARSDVFAFGAVLYEMATGNKAFAGKSQISVASAILEKDPEPISKLQPVMPVALDWIVNACLAKNPDDRIQSAHDLGLELRRIAGESGVGMKAPLPRAGRDWKAWVVAALATIAAVALATMHYSSAGMPASSVHSSIVPQQKTVLSLYGNAGGIPVVSPDGQQIAFIAKGEDGRQGLWLRSLNSSSEQLVTGTDGASFPFWSADSRYVGFFQNGKLNKVAASGGPPQVLTDGVSSGRGGCWNLNDTIIYANSSTAGLMKIDAAGGTPVPLTELSSKESSHRWPEFLPDGKHFIYFAHGSTPADSGIYVSSLDSKERKLLLHNDSNALYAAPGFLLFVRDSTLMAQHFDSGKLELAGDARPMVDHVAVNTDIWRGVITASSNGVLLYERGALVSGSQLVWYDRSGKPGKLAVADTAIYSRPKLSPDGKQLAVSIENNGLRDIWVIDLTRNTKTRITFGEGASDSPVWWPDGKSLVYSSGPLGLADTFYRKNADGSGHAERLLNTPGVLETPFSITMDGHYLSYMTQIPKSGTDWDIWVLPLNGDRKAFPAVNTRFLDATPAISPNAKWLAYANNESGRMESYIQPFPEGSGRWQVSTAGGNWPQWRRDGKEMYYRTPEGEIFAVDIRENGASVELGTPHLLFKTSSVAGPMGPYVVSADGKQFLINAVPQQSEIEPLTLVTNWTADLKK